jgi:hypothetical protein
VFIHLGMDSMISFQNCLGISSRLKSQNYRKAEIEIGSAVAGAGAPN